MPSGLGVRVPPEAPNKEESNMRSAGERMIKSAKETLEIAKQQVREAEERIEAEGAKDTVLMYTRDLVGAFLIYDRKEDEDLPVGKIEQYVRNGYITADEIVDQFRKELIAGLKQ